MKKIVKADNYRDDIWLYDVQNNATIMSFTEDDKFYGIVTFNRTNNKWYVQDGNEAKYGGQENRDLMIKELSILGYKFKIFDRGNRFKNIKIRDTENIHLSEVDINSSIMVYNDDKTLYGFVVYCPTCDKWYIQSGTEQHSDFYKSRDVLIQRYMNNSNKTFMVV